MGVIGKAGEGLLGNGMANGERPALRLVETPARRQSDKIVQLETRRNRGGLFDGLSTGEQAAFREIARQLGDVVAGERDVDGVVDLLARDTPARIAGVLPDPFDP